MNIKLNKTMATKSILLFGGLILGATTVAGTYYYYYHYHCRQTPNFYIFLADILNPPTPKNNKKTNARSDEKPY